MNIRKSLRLILLITVCGGVFGVLGKSILAPAAMDPTQKKFEFPSKVPLTGWQPEKSKNASDPVGKVYFYSKNNQKLKFEMYYVADASLNEKYFRQFGSERITSGNELKQTVQRQNQEGYYSLSVEGEIAYLRTCISPSGQSTITHDQFMRNRYENDFSFDRILPWLMGQVTLRDHRCLWAHLSLPLDKHSPKLAYQTLETAWVPWHAWWRNKFPDH